MELKLGNSIYTVDDNMDLYNKYRQYYRQAAIEASKKYCDTYLEISNIEKAMDALISLYSETADKLVKYSCKTLFEYGIYDVSADIFTEKYYDNYLNSDFLLLIGKLNDSSHIFLRSPLESVREGIKISNTFLLITTVMILFFSSILAFFISRRFTKPIYELNAITKKMSNLDFSTKYEVTSDDEIGMLGKSINLLSQNLETKIQELKEANIELEKDIEETSKLSQMRSQFISDVSHELKTPISLIQGSSALAQQSQSTDIFFITLI